MKIHCIFLFAFLLISLAFRAQEKQDDLLLPPPPPPPEMTDTTDREMPPPPPKFHEGHPEGGPQKFFRELQKSNPEEYQRLMKLRMENREEFMKEIGKLIPRPKRDFDQKQFERDKECWELARKIRACENEEEKTALRTELEAKLSTMTDEMIADMQKRITDLEVRLKVIQQNRESIQKKRVKFFLEAPLPPEK